VASLSKALCFRKLASCSILGSVATHVSLGFHRKTHGQTSFTVMRNKSFRFYYGQQLSGFVFNPLLSVRMRQKTNFAVILRMDYDLDFPQPRLDKDLVAKDCKSGENK